MDEIKNSDISAENRAEILNIIENFRLMDDTFMSKVFEDKACAELLLRVILNRDDLTVVRVVSQFELKNLQGRSARLDIYAVDEHGKQYDVEVQRSDDGAAPRRARYNSSLLDANLLNPGDKFDELPESYIIFITEHDVLKGGKPLYTVNRTISELDHAIFTDGSHIIYVNGEIRNGAAPRRARYNSSLLDANLLNPGDKFDELPESYIIFITEHDVLKGGKPLYTVNRTISELDHAIFTDGSHIIYVNGEIRNGTALGELMQDFFCKDPREMHYKVLSDRAGYFKKDKEGVDTMCKLVEDYGNKKTYEQAVRFATKLWNKGERDLQQIADLTDLPLDEVKKLFEGKTA